MNRAMRLSSLLLALLFALAIGYPLAAAGQAEKSLADRKAEDARKKERERQQELERLKAEGVDPNKLNGLRPGVDPTPKPPSARLAHKGQIHLKPEPQPQPKPRITSKKLNDSLSARSLDHSQRTVTGQTLPANDKDKKETPGSHHEGSEPHHKPELHKDHSGCEALRTQAEVEACKKAKADSKKSELKK